MVDNPEFLKLVDEAKKLMAPRQKALDATLSGLGRLCKVWLLGSEEVWWREGGVRGRIRVVAQVQLVGRLLLKERTWIWAWAEDRHKPALHVDALLAREFGKKAGIDLLTNPTFQTTEETAIQLALVTAKLADGDGMGMNRNNKVAGFEVLHRVRTVNEGSG
jgi:hypothetical protein